MEGPDYDQLYHNGQLIWTEPTHRAVLDRRYEMFPGDPTLNKYPEYMAAAHPVSTVPSTDLVLPELSEALPAHVELVDDEPETPAPEVVVEVTPEPEPAPEEAPVGFIKRKPGRPKKVTVEETVEAPVEDVSPSPDVH